jgi:hypothetical protein
MGVPPSMTSKEIGKKLQSLDLGGIEIFEKSLLIKVRNLASAIHRQDAKFICDLWGRRFRVIYIPTLNRVLVIRTL